MPFLRHHKIKGAFALLALALWLGSLALSACPSLHALAHASAGERDHHCVVTQIEGHSLLAALAQAVAPVPPAAQFGFVPLRSASLVLRPDHGLEPTRGPPSLLSASQVVG